MGGSGSENSAIEEKKKENQKHQSRRDVILAGDLWTDGLICAFEFVQGHGRAVGSKSGLKTHSAQQETIEESDKQVSTSVTINSTTHEVSSGALESVPLTESIGNDINPLLGHSCDNDCYSSFIHPDEKYPGSYWTPIGWSRISELVQTVQADTGWASQPVELTYKEDDLTVAEVAAPYWERPVGPTWWCHVTAGHPFINAWLSNAQWLHPAISTALRDESKLISERMKHLFYEVIFLVLSLYMSATSVCFVLLFCSFYCSHYMEISKFAFVAIKIEPYPNPLSKFAFVAFNVDPYPNPLNYLYTKMKRKSTPSPPPPKKLKKSPPKYTKKILGFVHFIFLFQKIAFEKIKR